MALSLSEFIELFKVAGAAVPIESQIASSARTLDLAGTTSTPPRSASYRGIRGAEFRTSAFDASTPQALATSAVSSALHSALYVANKIQTFTYLIRFRPSKTGLTALALTPVGGLFSATNMGATPWIHNQPCFVFIRQAAGDSRIVVSVMGAILDTSIATQTSGSTETEPSDDAAWQVVGVVVTGSTSTNNQVDSVKLVHVTQSGTRRSWSLGAHRAAALATFTTNPSNNQTITVNGRAYTFKSALAGTAATGAINGSGTNPADGDTVTIGTKVYTFKNSVGAATKATAIVSIANVDCTASTQAVTLTVGGYVLKIGFSTAHANGQAAGYLQGQKGGNAATDREDNSLVLHKCIHGDYDGQTSVFQIPASPTTGNNAGKDWALGSSNARNFSTKTANYVAASHQVEIQAIVAGVAGNAITLTVTDPNGSPIYSVSGATLTGGTDAPTAYSVKIGANWAATIASLVHAINFTGTPGTDYSADITAANPIASGAVNGNNVDLTSRLLGTAGNGQTLTESSAQLTVTAFANGTNGADADHVLIGGTAALTYANLLSALNLTGSPGLDYGSPTTLNADVTASLQAAGQLLLVAKAAGASGNSVTLATNAGDLAFKDEFGDKTATTLGGGTGAPPFTVAVGARPDQSDLRIFHGGLAT